YERYATFQPTFLYELIWNLLLAGALVWLGRLRKMRPPGVFALYVAGYSFARLWEELLGVDPAHHIFGLRLNFFVAVLLCAAGWSWFARTQGGVRRQRRRRGGALLAAGALICLSGCGQGSPSAHASSSVAVRAGHFSQP